MGVLLSYRIPPSVLCSWPTVTGDMAMMSILPRDMNKLNLPMTTFMVAIGTSLLTLTVTSSISTFL